MKTMPYISLENAPSPGSLAIHLVRAMTSAQRDGRSITLDDLVTELGVRRAEARGTLSTLHEQGLLDVTRMRLTLRGFALGQALVSASVQPLRASRGAQVHAA
jgi:DNA-binding IclR family transcriptional regulator